MSQNPKYIFSPFSSIKELMARFPLNKQRSRQIPNQYYYKLRHAITEQFFLQNQECAGLTCETAATERTKIITVTSLQENKQLILKGPTNQTETECPYNNRTRSVEIIKLK